MKIIQAPDLHLGFKAFRHTIDGWNARELDVYRTFTRMISDMIDREPDLVIFPGDVFHTPNPPVRAVREMRQGITRLREHNIPVEVIPGNHDMPTPGAESPIALLADRNLSSPWLRKVGDLHIMMCPPGMEKTAESEQLAARERCWFVGHFPIAGPEEYRRATTQVLPRGFERYLLGDLHSAYVDTSRNVAYAGCMDRLTFNQVGGFCGFFIHDTSLSLENSIESVQSIARDMLLLEDDRLVDGAEALKEADVTGRIVKVRTSHPLEEWNLDWIRAYAFNVAVERVKIENAAETPDAHEFSPQRSLMDEFTRFLQRENHPELREEAVKILREVSNE